MLLSVSEASAQNQIDIIRPGIYEQNGQRLKHRDLNIKLGTGPSKGYWLQAKNNKVGSDIFGGIGGFGLGYALSGLLFKPTNLTEAQESSRKKTNRAMLIGGGAGVLLSIPFTANYNKYSSLAVTEYNGTTPLSSQHTTSCVFGFGPSGARLTILF
jgi:hypothetical protein